MGLSEEMSSFPGRKSRFRPPRFCFKEILEKVVFLKTPTEKLTNG